MRERQHSLEGTIELQANPSFHAPKADTATGKPVWYVAYTYPRHEKAVAEQLKLRLVETFLPTYKHTSQWKDRRVKLDVPLFAGYVFTKLLSHDRVKVISVPGVIRMLCYRGLPVPVSEAEIDAIRMCIGRGGNVEPHPYMTVGDQVRVREGIFEGLQGIVVRQKNKCKLVVSIELIHQSVSLEVDPQSLERVTRADVRGREAIYKQNAQVGGAVATRL